MNQLGPDKAARPLRICVCTTFPAKSEPRAPRHAAYLANALGDEAEVTFVDTAAKGSLEDSAAILRNLPNLTSRTHSFDHRGSGLAALALSRLRRQTARTLHRHLGWVSPIALSEKCTGLLHLLLSVRADVYFAHTIEALLPAAQAASRLNARLMFDSMEFHSDMDILQTDSEKRLIRTIESRWLRRCCLVTASSDELADELARVYGIVRPLPLYNVPRLETKLPPPRNSPFELYWRNATIGLGQRGLEDALEALRNLPSEITLHIQGRSTQEGLRAVRRRIEELGIAARVIFHPPYEPEDAVVAAAEHTVGLCLERGGVRNHELTVSNKMFDYHMAGLAIVSSDLPSLRGVITRSGGGLLFESGSPDDLARKILSLYRDPTLAARLRANARAFALREAHLDREMALLLSAFRSKCIEAPSVPVS